MSDARSLKRRIRLVSYTDQPDRLFLEVARRRYWITSQELFEACGFSSWPIEVQERGIIPKNGAELVSVRQALALKYLNGVGVEIGALNNPALLPPDASVIYCDYVSKSDLSARYTELTRLTEVDFIDDGEHLYTVKSENLDFIIANHFLEASQNPLGAIRNHMDKLKPGGIAFYAVSDMRTNINKDRPISSFEHLVTDDMHGPEHSRKLRFFEYARLVDKAGSKEEIERHAELLMSGDHRIHFHVWDSPALRDTLAKAQGYLSGVFDILEIVDDNSEVVVVLQKR